MNGQQPISIADVLAYCSLCGIPDPITRMGVLHMVQEIDSEFLKWASEKRKQSEKGS